MKKIILLISLSIVLSLTACKGSSQDENATKTDPKTEATATASFVPDGIVTTEAPTEAPTDNATPNVTAKATTKVTDKPTTKVTQNANTNLKKPIDFTLKDLNGKEVTLSSFIGKKVFLNFWATWCPPCKGEMPDIEKIYKANKDDLVVLAVDGGEELDVVKKFISENKYTFPVLLDLDNAVSSKYKISAIPQSIFINKAGFIVYEKRGAMSEQEMKNAIAKLN